MNAISDDSVLHDSVIGPFFVFFVSLVKLVEIRVNPCLQFFACAFASSRLCVVASHSVAISFSHSVSLSSTFCTSAFLCALCGLIPSRPHPMLLAVSQFPAVSV